ncbi:uncharacterized protein TNCV_730801 [Trichonephila clavipes]|nr:uncharacterized protein TNCV_730801 [Trichonephila clavipes]
MFMYGDFGGQRKCLNSEECSWSHSVAIMDVWGVYRIVLLKFRKSVVMHNGMGAGDQTGCLYTCHLSESYLDVSGVPYHTNCTRPIPSQSLHQLEQSPVDVYTSHVSMDSQGCLHIRTRPSARFNWKRDSSEKATYFQSSTVQCRC